MPFIGEIMPGCGAARDKWKSVDDDIERIVGWRPHPGTLNIKLQLENWKTYIENRGPSESQFILRGKPTGFWSCKIREINSNEWHPGFTGHNAWDHEETLEVKAEYLAFAKRGVKVEVLIPKIHSTS